MALLAFLFLVAVHGFVSSSSKLHNVDQPSNAALVLDALRGVDMEPADCTCTDRRLCDRIRIHHEKEVTYKGCVPGFVPTVMHSNNDSPSSCFGSSLASSIHSQRTSDSITGHTSQL